MNSAFAQNITDWQHQHGRHHLPWQTTPRNPYYVWLSEIMLQQTQVTQMIPYFQKFIDRCPNFNALAQLDETAILSLWSGLGYYTRARNLLRCARIVVHEFNGQLPLEPSILRQLPGIGTSTANAIAAFCAHQRVAILDGNVRRVLARHFTVKGDVYQRQQEKKLWDLAEQLLPNDAELMPAYTQGIMDLGATLCLKKQPKCCACPLAATCLAHRTHSTEDYPQPRVRKAKKPRVIHWVRLHYQQYIAFCLQHMPGIWQGMWLWPEAADIYSRLPKAPNIIRTLGPKTHLLSHLNLTLSCDICYLSTAEKNALEPLPLIWHRQADIIHTPIPKAIRYFIADLA